MNVEILAPAGGEETARIAASCGADAIYRLRKRFRSVYRFVNLFFHLAPSVLCLFIDEFQTRTQSQTPPVRSDASPYDRAAPPRPPYP